MKTGNQINNLASLEREIFRHQLISKESEKQLQDDLSYLRKNFYTLAGNSFKKEKKKEENSSSFMDHLFRNDHVRGMVSGITTRITDHTAEAVSQLIDRLFQKHKY